MKREGKKLLNKSGKKQKRVAEQEAIDLLKEKCSSIIDTSNIDRFEDLPLSEYTLRGLGDAEFSTMTEIQQRSLGISLCGKDVLGAAKTGSGKTLAFLLPILECLYKENWTQYDGLGALIIAPTRELAIQIFEVLVKISKYHKLSPGLVIGGKSVQDEKDHITSMNILVSTPGRLLQHMDQTAGFDCGNLKILVLDEADRILDMGFEKTVNAIIENLPKNRQTLLFSATQTKSVKDLARLSLKDPEYIAVHEKAESSTPSELDQHYLVCELSQKLDILFSFIKTHLKAKVIVFLSSCKQVRFVYETFCKLQPGIPLMCLHGSQKQAKRYDISQQFYKKQSAVLFATDIVARGLDFPSVDWVLQVDCPEDVETYIHRVGRTARNHAAGHALLMLLPSEEKGMLTGLLSKNVPIAKIEVNPSKTSSIQQQLAGFCSQDPEIKYLAQKAFISYVRCVHLQRNKDIFKLEELSFKDFASSLGLPGAPKIKFVKKTKEVKNASRDNMNKKQIAKASELSSEEEDNNKKPQTRVERIFNRKNQSVLSDHYSRMVEKDAEENSADEFLTMVRQDHSLEGESTVKPMIPSKGQLKRAKKRKLKEVGFSKKLVFDDEGIAVDANAFEDSEVLLASNTKKLMQEHIEQEAEIMQQEDIKDKIDYKNKLREKKKRKTSEKEQHSGPIAQLGSSCDVSEEDHQKDGADYESDGSLDILYE